MAIKDLTNQTLNSVYVVSFDGTDKYGHAYFMCRCLLCGKIFKALGTNLLSGKTKSCGCIGTKNRELGRNKTLQEALEYKTNVGKLRSAKPLKSNKTTGIRGVCFIKSQGKYKAYITFQGVKYVLKYSDDIKDCIRARLEAEKKLHDNFLQWYDKLKEDKKMTIK